MVTAQTRPYRIDKAGSYATDHGLPYIPRLEVRKSVKLGYFVKLAFLSDAIENGVDNERLWVEVTGKSGDLYTGLIRSGPAFLKGLLLGEVVLFGPENICDVSK